MISCFPRLIPKRAPNCAGVSHLWSVRGRALLLLGQEVVEICLLGSGEPKSQRHSIDQRAAVGAAKIETRRWAEIHAHCRVSILGAPAGADLWSDAGFSALR